MGMVLTQGILHNGYIFRPLNTHTRVFHTKVTPQGVRLGEVGSGIIDNCNLCGSSG